MIERINVKIRLIKELKCYIKEKKNDNKKGVITYSYNNNTMKLVITPLI